MTKGAKVSAFVRRRVHRHEPTVADPIIRYDLQLHRVFIQVVGRNHAKVIIGKKLGHGLLLAGALGVALAGALTLIRTFVPLEVQLTQPTHSTVHDEKTTLLLLEGRTLVSLTMMFMDKGLNLVDDARNRHQIRLFS